MSVVIVPLKAQINNKLDKSGGTMTGILTSNFGVNLLNNIPIRGYEKSGTVVKTMLYMNSSNSIVLGSGDNGVVFSIPSSSLGVYDNSAQKGYSVWHSGNLNPDLDYKLLFKGTFQTKNNTWLGQISFINYNFNNCVIFNSDRIRFNCTEKGEYRIIGTVRVEGASNLHAYVNDSTSPFTALFETPSAGTYSFCFNYSANAGDYLTFYSNTAVNFTLKNVVFERLKVIS